MKFEVFIISCFNCSHADWDCCVSYESDKYRECVCQSVYCDASDSSVCDWEILNHEEKYLLMKAEDTHL